MNPSLALAGLAMGAAASPHCALMCGAPCATITQGRRRAGVVFHGCRVLSYMAGGALAAAGVSLLGTWMRSSQVLLPLWTLVQLGFLALGLWWLIAGRMPRRGHAAAVTQIRFVRARAPSASWAGLAWVAWPCGMLQGALLLAALADTPTGGALIMACFAVASAPALVATPWLWARRRRGGGPLITQGQFSSLGYRVAGVALTATSTWAVWQSLHERIARLCSS